MNCENCQQRLVEHVLGELDASLADQIEQHLNSKCIACTDALRSLHDAIDQVMIDTVGSGEINEILNDANVRQRIWKQVESRLEWADSGTSKPDRVAGRSPSAAAPQADRNLPRTRHISPWLTAALAVACGFAVVSFSLRFAHPDRASKKTGVGFESVKTGAKSTSAQIVSLRPAKGSPQESGTLIYDVAANQIHFFATGLAPPNRGEHYAIWFVTVEQEWIFGGKLTVVDGVAAQVIDVPNAKDRLLYAAITRDSETTNRPVHGAVALVSDDVNRLIPEAIE